MWAILDPESGRKIPLGDWTDVVALQELPEELVRIEVDAADFLALRIKEKLLPLGKTAAKTEKAVGFKLAFSNSIHVPQFLTAVRLKSFEKVLQVWMNFLTLGNNLHLARFGLYLQLKQTFPGGVPHELKGKIENEIEAIDRRKFGGAWQNPVEPFKHLRQLALCKTFSLQMQGLASSGAGWSTCSLGGEVLLLQLEETVLEAVTNLIADSEFLRDKLALLLEKWWEGDHERPQSLMLVPSIIGWKKSSFPMTFCKLGIGAICIRGTYIKHGRTAAAPSSCQWEARRLCSKSIPNSHLLMTNLMSHWDA
jgi:hypothetical protein